MSSIKARKISLAGRVATAEGPCGCLPSAGRAVPAQSDVMTTNERHLSKRIKDAKRDHALTSGFGPQCMLMYVWQDARRDSFLQGGL